MNVISVVPHATYSVVVGAGGAPGSYGGDSYFGSGVEVRALGGNGADANEIADLRPLSRMPLNECSINGNRVTNLKALRGMHLNDINCGGNKVDSLEPLRGMPLSTVKCQCNRIRTLEPLKDVHVSTLMCGGNRLATLKPFLEEPPTNFWYDCDTIADKELKGMRQAWSRDPRHAEYAKTVSVLLALRRSDRAALRKLARKFKGCRYLFIPRFVRWKEAQTICETLGGHLVDILSPEENDFLETFFPYGGSWMWIGLHAEQGALKWITGKPVQYHAFVDEMHAWTEGPKVYRGRHWFYELNPHAHNCFMIKWDS